MPQIQVGQLTTSACLVDMLDRPCNSQMEGILFEADILSEVVELLAL